MICLYANSRFCTITLTVYTYIFIAFLQILHSILSVLSYLSNPHQLPGNYGSQENSTCGELNLPVSVYSDIKEETQDGDEEEEMCSICLMEFEDEDFVNKLPRCGHVFHGECMDKWLDRSCQFTCPLCRSSLLHAANSSAKCKFVI